MKKIYKINSIVILLLTICTVCVVGLNHVVAVPSPLMDDGPSIGHSHMYDFGNFTVDVPGGVTLMVIKHKAYANSSYQLKSSVIEKVPSQYDALGAGNLTLFDSNTNGNFSWVKARVNYSQYNHSTGSYYYYGEHGARTSDDSATLVY